MSLRFSTAWISTALVGVVSQSALAAPTQITTVQLQPTSNGIVIVLTSSAGTVPQIFATNRGDRWTADLVNTQLRLPQGKRFRQDNPVPGITSISIDNLDGNRVRVTVISLDRSLKGQISTSQNDTGSLNLVLTINRSLAPLSPVPQQLASGSRLPAQTDYPNPPLIPNPKISIEGKPSLPNRQTLPLDTHAVAPPVGAFAVSPIDTSPSIIDLGSNQRIPRLVLRDAPTRDVLSLLARAAGLNLAYLNRPATETAQSTPVSDSTTSSPTVSLDIENESVQDVFNYVLRLSGLEANKVGHTVFVGPKLPNMARNLIARSLRLNQTSVVTALNFLVGLGAESAVSRERLITSVNAVPVGTGTSGPPAITQTQTTTESRIESQRLQLQDSVPILRGLQVLGDERTNSVTLVGAPNLVEFAIAQLTRLDVRRRQVSVNVRVIDVNLSDFQRTGTSFSFGVGDTRFISDAGVGVINFGSTAPAASTTAFQNDLGFDASNIGLQSVGSSLGLPFNFVRNFLLQLQASVRAGNAKILTDPTLVVQEGQTATVNLTEEVVTNFTLQSVASTGSTQVTASAVKERAGLVLPIQVDRIDDNGFISLSVAPSISRPAGTTQISVSGSTNTITLLAERRLQSGQIRIRDGQTLILSGIIQDSDRTSVAKLPILGDLPLLGALFRRTEHGHSRQEVIVLLTPRILDDLGRTNGESTYMLSPDAQRLLQIDNHP